jgi:hypothetical protein
VDNDCDGSVDENNICSCADADGDGFPAVACGGTDCLDTNPAVHPGASEFCDGLDDDCDGALPLNEADLDGDSYRACAGDCLDNNAAIHPAATEACDNIDNDCDSSTADGSGNPLFGTPCSSPSCPQGTWICGVNPLTHVVEIFCAC